MKISSINYVVFFKMGFFSFLLAIVLKVIADNFNFGEKIYTYLWVCNYIFLQLGFILFIIGKVILYSNVKKYINLALESLCVFIILIIETLKLFIELGNYGLLTFLFLIVIALSMLNYEIYWRKNWKVRD